LRIDKGFYTLRNRLLEERKNSVLGKVFSRTIYLTKMTTYRGISNIISCRENLARMGIDINLMPAIHVFVLDLNRMH